MPRPTSKSRQELRSRFVRNAIPTETDFADLIAASLNQADDGVLKLPDQPLGLVRQKPDQPVLRFFADPAAEGSVWQVQLGAGDKPGFGLAAADGKLALFVDGGTGNVGIGTAESGNKLTIQGVSNQYRDPESGITNGGLLALKGNAPQIDFIDTEHGDWAIHVNEGRMYFIREPWEYEDLVLDGKGNIGIGTSVPEAKLNISEITGTPASALKGTLLLDHEDAEGASSIVFRSKGNRGSDHAFIEFRDKNPLINDGEAALLTIGMQNDINDHIALMPSGNVGIGTTTPGCKLDVNGDASIGGSLRIGAGCEIFFPKYGQIRSLDDAHRILFRIDDSKMELREYGDIVFSSGSTQGQETSKMVIHRSGNVGIGTTMPAAKLQITGNVCITSADGESYSCRHNFMAPGSLTIGGNDRNYGGGTNWNDNTAGLLLETLDNTEIAIHDSNLRLASFMYYESANNCFTIGRDMGWGPIATVNVQGGLKVNGKVDSSNARFQATANDPISIKIAPIKIAPIKIAPIKIAPDKIAPDKIAPDKIAPDDWTDMSKMIVTASIDGPVLVLFKTGGVQGAPGKNVRARFRLLIDNIEKAFTLHEFHNEGWELRDASLMWLESLTPGNHEFKVQWRAEGGEVCACFYNDLRSLIVIKL